MKTETLERRQNIVNIMSQNEEFIIIGLTGRVGSGCSEAAEIFGSTFQQLELPWIQPGTQGLRNDEERDLRILQRYAGAHWLKFDVIRTRTIISSFILEEFDEFAEVIVRLLKKQRGETELTVDSIKETLYKQICENISRKESLRVHIKGENLSLKSVEEYIELVLNALSSIARDFDSKTIKDSHPLEAPPHLDEEKIVWKKILDAFNKIGRYYSSVDEGECMEERSRYLGAVEDALCKISAMGARYILQVYDNSQNDKSIWRVMEEINADIESTPLENGGDEDNIRSIKRLKRFIFVHDLMPAFGDAIHDYFRENNLPFTELYQKYGNSIRCYGKVLYTNQTSALRAADVFSIPRKIVRFIKTLRHPFSNRNSRPVRIVIDSVKNVFEATYLRQRYSSFYLFAISTDEDIRKKRLLNSEKKNLTLEQIRFIDWNEYSSEGIIVYNRIKREISENRTQNCTATELNFYNSIVSSDEDAILNDYVRKHAYDKNLQQFYLQDVAASIENADVFISNNYDNKVGKNMELIWAIVRNVCLIMFPGLLLPTPIEKCMQIAFASKCNSGCLSRQVGAVVTDKEYNILSIGCNDVPYGDISCARKNLVDLCKLEDSPAYTNYELENIEFRQQIGKFRHIATRLSRILRGLPMRYCFKDLHLKGKNQEKNPMRTRAMHAEEKALSICGERCAGGCLFTTSSPCEMCSKNAKNHRIKKIYYIEVYPGISEAQYSRSGDSNNIAEHILFTGAIGRAYVQMYTPIMPQKDILSLLGVYDEYWVE